MSFSVLLTGGRVFSRGGVIENGAVGIDGRRIAAIGHASEFGKVSAGLRLDCSNALVTAGLVDIQVNGGGGYMFSTDIRREAFEDVARAHLRLGTTAICPTVISGPLDDMIKAIRLVSKLSENPLPGCARLAGIHVEGPFLAESKRGGHAAANLRMPTVEEARMLVEAGDGRVRIFSLAPELPGALEVIEYLARNGVMVSAAHSSATAQQMQEAVVRGLSGATHLFNGMDGLLNRAPGIVGATLSSDTMVGGLIGDMLHVSPLTLLTAIRAKRCRQLYLTTDAVSPMGSSADSFELYGVTVTVRDGGCYTENGTLAGTATPLARMVKNVRDVVGIAEATAIDMATAVPASVIGQERQIGSLFVGAIADVAVFTTDFQPVHVFVDGAKAA